MPASCHEYADGELSHKQIDAGLAAMGRQFDAFKVMAALRKVGLQQIVPASERLIARELNAGRISKVTQGIYGRS